MLLGLQTKIEGARENVQRGLQILNKDYLKCKESWGKIAPTTENFNLS
jgi:hypothetical protein